MRDLFAIEREFGVVKVDGSYCGIRFGAFSYFRALGVIYKDRKAAKDDGFDFEEVFGVYPDYGPIRKMG